MSASLIGRLGSSAFRLFATTVSMSLAGSCFSSESAPRPFQCVIRGRGGTIFGAAVPSYRQWFAGSHPQKTLLSAQKFDLHPVYLTYGSMRKSRKGTNQPRARRQPCNCREDFLHLDAGECLTDAAMRTRAENRMPSGMVLAEDIEVVGIGIHRWIPQSRGHGNGEQSTGGNSIAIQVKIPDNDTGDSHDHGIETQSFVHRCALETIGIGTESAPLIHMLEEMSERDTQ